VTIDEFWIDDRIYWTLDTQRLTALYRSLLHTHYCPQSRLHCRCLVAASNGGRSSSSGFLNCPRPPTSASNSNSSQDQIFITVRQLRVCSCRAPSMTRERVCRSQQLLALASAVSLVPTWSYCSVSDSRLAQHIGPGPRIYIPQEQGGPVITPGTGFPFRRLLRLAGLRWRHSNPPPSGE
jgi:hypothetical protein